MGVPLIGCDCPVCTSDNPRNKRYRPSVLVSHEGKHVLIDASPDLRSQALDFKVNEVHAVLFTHHHADHILGIDDLRLYNFNLGAKMPCYSNRFTLKKLKGVFDYAFDDGESEQSRPSLDPIEVNGPFDLFEMRITPFELFHGSLPVLGFLFEDSAGQCFGYATDCSRIPEESFKMLRGVDLLILDALRHIPHPTHFSLEEAVEMARELKPRQTLFTHIAHQMEHEKVNSSLPSEIQLAHDGQVVDLSD